MPPAGPQAQGWTGSARASTVSIWLRLSGIYPLAIGQDRSWQTWPRGRRSFRRWCAPPSPRGQARYPEGGRRREDEPPGEGWRVRVNAGDDEHQGDEHLVSGPRGARAPVPPCMAPVAAFSAPTVLRGRGRIFPAPARGNPAPRVGSLKPCPLRARSDRHPGYLTASQRQVAIPADLRTGSPTKTG